MEEKSLKMSRKSSSSEPLPPLRDDSVQSCWPQRLANPNAPSRDTDTTPLRRHVIHQMNVNESVLDK